jgi:large subunit ribosomal protein L9
MKVLLMKDVFKLGRAGDVKRVADGYGRNYLMPQGLAVLATPGALKQVERIKARATIQREVLNEELGDVAEQLNGMVLSFTARASETGKLYGSITTQMIADSITEKTGVEINRRQVFSQPLRSLGEHPVQIRLTIDLIPEVTVIVNSEGEEQEAIEMQEPVKPSSDEEEELQDEEQVASSSERDDQEQEAPEMQEPVEQSSDEGEDLQDEEQVASLSEKDDQEQEAPEMQQPLEQSSDEEEELQDEEQVASSSEGDDQELGSETGIVEETEVE